MRPVWILLGIMAVLLIISVAIHIRFLSLWVLARHCGVPISFHRLLRMLLRKVDPADIVTNRCVLAQAAINVPWNSLEAHRLAGGDLTAVVTSLTAARLGGLAEITWDELCAADLAGRDVQEEVAARLQGRRTDGAPPAGQPAAGPGKTSPREDDSGSRAEPTPEA